LPSMMMATCLSGNVDIDVACVSVSFVLTGFAFDAFTLNSLKSSSFISPALAGNFTGSDWREQKT